MNDVLWSVALYFFVFKVPRLLRFKIASNAPPSPTTFAAPKFATNFNVPVQKGYPSLRAVVNIFPTFNRHLQLTVNNLAKFLDRLLVFDFFVISHSIAPKLILILINL